MFRCLSAVLFFIALLLGASSAGVAANPQRAGRPYQGRMDQAVKCMATAVGGVLPAAHPRSQEGPRPGHCLPRGRREEFRPRFAVACDHSSSTYTDTRCGKSHITFRKVTT